MQPRQLQSPRPARPELDFVGPCNEDTVDLNKVLEFHSVTSQFHGFHQETKLGAIFLTRQMLLESKATPRDVEKNDNENALQSAEEESDFDDFKPEVKPEPEDKPPVEDEKPVVVFIETIPYLRFLGKQVELVKSSAPWEIKFDKDWIVTDGKNKKKVISLINLTRATETLELTYGLWLLYNPEIKKQFIVIQVMFLKSHRLYLSSGSASDSKEFERNIVKTLKRFSVIFPAQNMLSSSSNNFSLPRIPPDPPKGAKDPADQTEAPEGGQDSDKQNKPDGGETAEGAVSTTWIIDSIPACCVHSALTECCRWKTRLSKDILEARKTTVLDYILLFFSCMEL